MYSGVQNSEPTLNGSLFKHGGHVCPYCLCFIVSVVEGHARLPVHVCSVKVIIVSSQAGYLAAVSRPVLLNDKLYSAYLHE